METYSEDALRAELWKLVNEANPSVEFNRIEELARWKNAATKQPLTQCRKAVTALLKTMRAGLRAKQRAEQAAAKAAPKGTAKGTSKRTLVVLEDHEATAFAFYRAKFPDHSEGSTLQLVQGVFYRWNGPDWAEIGPKVIEHAVRNWLSRECEHETYDHVLECWVIEPVMPNVKLVNEVVSALAAVVDHRTPHADAELQHGWIGGASAGNWVAVQNGLLDLKSMTLEEHSPDFFNTTSIQADWDPDAGPIAGTVFERFLHDLLVVGGHAAVVAADKMKADYGGKRALLDGEDQLVKLQEVLGYIVSGDTDLQKIFATIGPARSGKGTMMLVIGWLLNGMTTSTNTTKISKPFGMQGMIGRSVCFLPDVRIDKNTDHAPLAETLLSVSGGDQQSIGRKYLPDWIGILRIRFWLASNSFPQFRDADGVLVHRFEIFDCPNSFLGKEDHGLFEKLTVDADRILKWAVIGCARLKAQKGRFTLTKAHQRLAGSAAARMDPIGGLFSGPSAIFEVTTDPEDFVTSEDLWAGFHHWAEQNNILGFSHDGFFKRLAAKDWQIKRVRRSLPFSPNHRGWGWCGIRWRGGKPEDLAQWRAEAQAEASAEAARSDPRGGGW